VHGVKIVHAVGVKPAPNLLAAHFNLFVGHTGLRERSVKCCFVGTAQAFTRV
jgi:hypothetical protein